ncbi:MAG TPA: DUF2314 domain-containing protein [Longimicrobium sp.]
MMTNPCRCLPILALSAALVACGGTEGTAQPEKRATAAASGPIVDVTQDDAEMNAAIARARATSGELLARLRQPPSGMSYLGVKVQVGDDRRGEHIWLYGVRLEGERIAGRLLDDAEYFPQYHQGDEIRVLPSEISDWMTVEDGHACGGFTARVLIPRLSPAERKEYLRSMEIPRLPPGDQVCDGGAGR